MSVKNKRFRRDLRKVKEELTTNYNEESDELESTNKLVELDDDLLPFSFEDPDNDPLDMGTQIAY